MVSDSPKWPEVHRGSLCFLDASWILVSPARDTQVTQFRYFRWNIVQTGTAGQICFDSMKISAGGIDYHPSFVRQVAISAVNPNARRRSGSWKGAFNGHWCGSSSDASGANLVFDMGTPIPFETYAFKVDDAICKNDPRRWSWQGSSDAKSWVPLGGVVHHNCSLLDHGKLNTFHFPPPMQAISQFS